MAIAANTDQKRENLLNLSLSVSEEERMRSESLETGFDREERTWELIVKYFGDLSGLRERGIQVRELLSGYWYTEGAGISGGLCYKLTGN